VLVIPFPLSNVNKAVDKEFFQASFTAIEALLKCLWADGGSGSFAFKRADKLAKGGLARDGRGKERNEEFFGTKELAHSLDEAGFFRVDRKSGGEGFPKLTMSRMKKVF